MTKAMGDFQYDVFISYSSYDSKWVWEWLVPRLNAAGLRICTDRETFDVGVASLINMERAVEQSRKTLLVLTPNWVQSEWTNLEALLVQSGDPIGLQRRMIPMMLEECKPPKRISIFTHANFTEPSKRESELVRVIEAINDKINLAQAVDVIRTAFIPRLPKPYLVHPYPMPKHWSGRRAEMDELDSWLKDQSLPLCCLAAIGGTGKSSLTWAWLQERVLCCQEALNLGGVFQWSFYEGDSSFQHFLECFKAYLELSANTDPTSAVVQYLREHRVLVVLDGFERLLGAYAAADAVLLPEWSAEELKITERRCAEWLIARFLRSLVAGAISKVLLISRLVPEELDDLAGWKLMELSGLAPSDAVAYLRASGIKGTSRELREAAAVYGFHPLSLSKLVNVLHYDINRPDDICHAPHYEVTVKLKARQHHILERAYEILPVEVRQFLSALAAIRGNPTMDVVRFLADDWSETELAASLQRLEEDRWLQWDRERGNIVLHPVVRRYTYGCLKDRKRIHARLADYFRPLAETVESEGAESVVSLAPVIELYHHVVSVGRYEEGSKIFRERLAHPLYFCFGAYATEIELLRELFPEGENGPPKLKSEMDQVEILAALAPCYAMVGQPRQAVPLYELLCQILEPLEDKKNLALGLGGVAVIAYTPLGELEVAESSLRRSIDLCSEIEDAFRKAIHQTYLGLVLAFQGKFARANHKLLDALGVFTETDWPSWQGVTWGYRALCALLMGDKEAGLDAALRARELADVKGYERDIIRAEWLLGESYRALGQMPKARTCLTEALTRCRQISMVDHEPDILLGMARMHCVEEVGEQSTESTGIALALAQEALSIANRCEYRLKQADIYNFLAEIALRQANSIEVRRYAEMARKQAWCQGPPHWYRTAVEKADKLLQRVV